jgi:PKD repeat protein
MANPLNPVIYMKPVYTSLFITLVFLLQGCYPEPVANFDFSYSDNAAPALVTFSNYSTDADEYLWNFGDGGTSSTMSPTHTYEVAGTFSISLKASGRGGENVMSKSITIIQPTTYIVRNSTSYVLYDVSSYYWTGSEVLDFVNHGIMYSGNESAEYITGRSVIDLAFRFSPDGDIVLVADSYYISANTRNYLIITDNTQVIYSTGVTKGALVPEAVQELKKDGTPVLLKDIVTR